jgi:hypothetical protein
VDGEDERMFALPEECHTSESSTAMEKACCLRTDSIEDVKAVAEGLRAAGSDQLPAGEARTAQLLGRAGRMTVAAGKKPRPTRWPLLGRKLAIDELGQRNVFHCHTDSLVEHDP